MFALTAVNLKAIWGDYRSICRRRSPLHVTMIMQELGQLVPTTDLTLVSLRMGQSCSACIVQGKKGQRSFLRLHEDWPTNIKKMVSFGVLFSVLSQIKEYLFLNELSHVCINVSSLHYRLPVLSAEIHFKKGDIKWAGLNAASKIRYKKGRVFMGVIYT